MQGEGGVGARGVVEAGGELADCDFEGVEVE